MLFLKFLLYKVQFLIIIYNIKMLKDKKFKVKF